MSTTGPVKANGADAKVVNGKGHRPRVLFADDDADMLEPLAYFAAKRGWEADVATSVEQIMAHISRRCEEGGEGPCYDAFVFDITFRGGTGPSVGERGSGERGAGESVSGVQAVRAIRRRLPDVPVIFITGWTSRLVTAEAQRVGQEVIVKPFDVHHVLDRVEVWMSWAGELRSADYEGPERRNASINRSGYYRRTTDRPILINERVAAAVGGGADGPTTEARRTTREALNRERDSHQRPA